MKSKGLIITTISFFIIVNTNYFWEGKFGLFAFPAFLLLVIVFFGLVLLLLRQIFFAFKENFRKKQRLITIGLLTIVLTLTFFKPNGLIDFDSLQGKDLLVAEREGAANCMTTLKLKENNKFKERSVCFGITEIKGNFEFRNDTIYFKDIEYGRHENEYYEFAVIRPSIFNSDKISYDLVRYKNQNDTIGHELWIIKNELEKN